MSTSRRGRRCRVRRALNAAPPPRTGLARTCLRIGTAWRYVVLERYPVPVRRPQFRVLLLVLPELAQEWVEREVRRPARILRYSTTSPTLRPTPRHRLGTKVTSADTTRKPGTGNFEPTLARTSRHVCVMATGCLSCQSAGSAREYRIPGRSCTRHGGRRRCGPPRQRVAVIAPVPRASRSFR